MTTDVEAGQPAESTCEPTLDAAAVAATAPSPARPGPLARTLRLVLAVLTAQYTLIAIGTGLSVAATVKYVVTPQVVAKFEAVSAALKR